MAYRGKAVAPPAEHYRQGEWPSGRPLVRAHPAAAVAAGIARRLGAALDGADVKAVAAEAGVSRTTVYEIVGGQRWPEIVTVVQLEQALGVPLLQDAPPA